MRNALDQKMIFILIFGPFLIFCIYLEISSKLNNMDGAGERHRLVFSMRMNMSDGELQQFLTKKIDLNIQDEDGVSFLEAAVIGEKIKNVQWLLKHGADVNHQDHFGRTSLHIAVAEQNYAITETLLSAGAIPSMRDSRNALPIDLAKDEKIKIILNSTETKSPTKNH